MMIMTGSSNYTAKSQEDIDAYNRGWARFLVDILQEQVDRLQVNDTRTLRASIMDVTKGAETLEHRFLIYGVYVAAGVGKGYSHGNGGNLLFLGDSYRSANGYGSRQVGAGLSSHAMLGKFEHITVRHGRNKGKTAALTRGKRQREDWFMKKYYYQLQRLNEKNALMYGQAYQGMVSTFLEGLFAKVGSENRIRSNRF